MLKCIGYEQDPPDHDSGGGEKEAAL